MTLLGISEASPSLCSNSTVQDAIEGTKTWYMLKLLGGHEAW